jgi:hypothetical protein
MHPKGTKSGMVLVFTLVVLLLMSLMGVVILTNAQTELKITGNTRLGREAFNSADSCARIATLMSIVLLNPKNEDVGAIYANNTLNNSDTKFPLKIEPTARFTSKSLIEEATNFDYTSRYKETGIGSSAAEDPHIIFKVKDRDTGVERVVATAVISLETHNILSSGASLGTGEPHESGDGPSVQVGIIVSVTGRTNTLYSSTGDEPASIVTIMYRNFLN